MYYKLCAGWVLEKMQSMQCRTPLKEHTRNHLPGTLLGRQLGDEREEEVFYHTLSYVLNLLL